MWHRLTRPARHDLTEFFFSVEGKEKGAVWGESHGLAGGQCSCIVSIVDAGVADVVDVDGVAYVVDIAPAPVGGLFSLSLPPPPVPLAPATNQHWISETQPQRRNRALVLDGLEPGLWRCPKKLVTRRARLVARPKMVRVLLALPSLVIAGARIFLGASSPSSTLFLAASSRQHDRNMWRVSYSTSCEPSCETLRMDDQNLWGDVSPGEPSSLL